MEIRTERLRLRERERTDAAETTHYRNRSAFLEHYPWSEWTHDRTIAELEAALETARQCPRRSYMLAMELAESGRPLIGCCRIEAHEVDNRAEIGYDLSADHWGKGLATEAVAALVDWYLSTTTVAEVEARCVAANHRSIRLLERLGFRRESTLPPGPGKGEGDWAWPERHVYLLAASAWQRPSPYVAVG